MGDGAMGDGKKGDGKKGDCVFRFMKKPGAEPGNAEGHPCKVESQPCIG